MQTTPQLALCVMAAAIGRVLARLANENVESDSRKVSMSKYLRKWFSADRNDNWGMIEVALIHHINNQTWSESKSKLKSDLMFFWSILLPDTFDFWFLDWLLALKAVTWWMVTGPSNCRANGTGGPPVVGKGSVCITYLESRLRWDTA